MPFKGTEWAINQRTSNCFALHRWPEIIYHSPDDFGLLAVFYLWRSQPCHLYPLFFPSQCIYSQLYRHKSPPINGDSWGKSGPVILQPHLFSMSNSAEWQGKLQHTRLPALHRMQINWFTWMRFVFIHLDSQDWEENRWSCTLSLTYTALPVSGTIT